jgi:hypothetical protein
MSLLRIVLASLAGFVAYFFVGGLAFGLIPSLKNEFLKYPAVYRPQQGQMSHMPVGMAAMYVAVLALTVLFALLRPGRYGLAQGHVLAP